MSVTRPIINTAACAALALIANVAVASAADMVPAYKAPVSAPAVQQASGYVEVYGGWASLRIEDEFFSDRFNGWALGGAGRANYWFSHNASVQLDAQAEGTSYRINGLGPVTGNASQQSFLIGGHINWRDSQRGLLGAFVGAGDGGGGTFSPSQRHVVAGVEGQLYWSQFTLYVQGGYDTAVGNSFFGDPHAWFVRGTGRYFVTPNTMFEGTVLYANGDISFDNGFVPVPSIDFHTWLWEAKLEHRFAATPFAMFLKYRGSETTFEAPVFATADFKATDHRVLVGLRLFMGQDTLQSNDRGGATLDIIDPLGVPSMIFFAPVT
jgi:hypothetical protein